MNAVPRRRPTALLALVAFVAALLPLGVATAYFIYRERQLIAEVEALENRLRELDAQLAPIGHLDRLRAEMLARKSIVDVLQEPQRSLHAALALTTRIPANARLAALDGDSERLTLQLTGADAAAVTQMLEHIDAVGFGAATAAPAAADGSIMLTARPDRARLAAAASRAVTP